MFLARLEGALLSKADKSYVAGGGRLITKSENYFRKTLQLKFFILLFNDA